MKYQLPTISQKVQNVKTLAKSAKLELRGRISMESQDGSKPVPIDAPKVYRAMKRDPADNLPVVGSGSSSELGARPGIDVSVDAAGQVMLDASGMSVAPNWRDLEFTRIPRRLRHLVPGAAGGNGTACFTMGNGPFERGVFAAGLELIPDQGQAPIKHGVIAPRQAVALDQYLSALANTRAQWRIDET